jgi:hypothetical protein
LRLIVDIKDRKMKVQTLLLHAALPISFLTYATIASAQPAPMDPVPAEVPMAAPDAPPAVAPVAPAPAETPPPVPETPPADVLSTLYKDSAGSMHKYPPRFRCEAQTRLNLAIVPLYVLTG